MIIDHISLVNFRNYGRLDLDVGPSVNIVYGNNAQGKTNLLEAIDVCSSLSSNRSSKDRNLIKLGEEEYEIEMNLIDKKDGFNTSLFVGFYTENSKKISGNSQKRVLKQDGIQISKISEYMGICNTVTFAPEDLNIVKGAPTVRRKFLNVMISKVSPSYLNLLNKTGKLINQKNAVLKKYKGNTDNINDMELDFWDFSLSEVFAQMILNRRKYIKLLSEYATGHHSSISDGHETLSVNYSTITGTEDLINKLEADNKTEKEIEKALSDFILEKIKKARISDVEKGVLSVGVHRDDIEIKLNGLEMRTFSSQGQQRSASLSLKLAELDIIRYITSTTPVLLLDELFSELDINRRVKIISGMTDAQIFITCTDRKYIEEELNDLIKDVSDVRYFRVEKGTIFAE